MDHLGYSDLEAKDRAGQIVLGEDNEALRVLRQELEDLANGVQGHVDRE